MAPWRTTAQRGFQLGDTHGTVASTGAQGRQSTTDKPETAAASEPRHVAPTGGRTGRGGGRSGAARPAKATAPPAATAQNKAPQGNGNAQQNLKQMAAKTRADKLRSALQQLRATKPLPRGAGEQTAQPPLTPHPPCQHQQLLQHPPGAAVRSSNADEFDSDPEDIFDDISLCLLARLRLGGSPQHPQASSLPPHQGQLGQQRQQGQQGPRGQPGQRGPQQAAGVLGSARQALLEAAADAEMPPPSGLCRVEAGNDLTAAAATMQLRLQHLRDSLGNPDTSTPQPCHLPTGLDTPGGANRQQQQQPAAGGEQMGAEPRRQRLAAGDLVVTRPPSPAPLCASTAAAQYAPAAAASAGSWRSLEHQPAPWQHQQQQPLKELSTTTNSISCYSSSGSSAAARLAALLPQPVQPASEHISYQPFVEAGNTGSSLLHSRQTSQSLPLPTAPTRRALPPRASSMAPAAVSAAAAAAAVEQPRDILEAWRSRRREAQAGQLTDKDSRYLSLQQLPAPTSPRYGSQQQLPAPTSLLPPQEHVHVVVAGNPRELSSGRQQAGWGGGAGAGPQAGGRGAAGQLQYRPPAAGAIDSSMASGSIASGSMQGDSGGDILERWRARRRQQQLQQQQQGPAAAGSTADYVSMLTLRLPGSAAAPASLAAPPARSGSMAPCSQQAATAAAATVPVSRPQGVAVAEASTSMQEGSAFGSKALVAPLEHNRQARQPVSTAAAGSSAASMTCAVEVEAFTAAQVAALASGPAATSSSMHMILPLPAALLPQLEQLQLEQPGWGGQLTAAVAERGAIAVAVAAAEAVAEEAAATAAGSCSPSRQPSRPASATSTGTGSGGSGRATPRSSMSMALDSSRGSASWSPGISRLMDDCIGHLLFSDFADGEAERTQPAAEPVLPLTTLATGWDGNGGGSDGGQALSGRVSSQLCAQDEVRGQQPQQQRQSQRQQTQQEQQQQQSGACPDPADLGFLSTSNSPGGSAGGGSTSRHPSAGSGSTSKQAGGGGTASRPPSAVVVNARALLAEAVLLLDHEMPLGTSAATVGGSSTQEHPAAAPAAGGGGGEGRGGQKLA